MKCPHCGKVPYPAKNDDGSWNWKNLFRVDVLSAVLVISIILILLGVKQINEQCYQIVQDPCKAMENLTCNKPFEIDNNAAVKNAGISYGSIFESNSTAS